MNFFHKAIARGITLPNILSWTSLESMRVFGSLWGTARLKLKAALLGIKIGKGVTAHGPVSLMRWPGGEISIGSGVSLISSWRRATAAALNHPVRLRVFGPGGAICIGKDCQLSGTSITARSKCIEIGERVLFGPNCVVTDSDFHAHWPACERIKSPGYEMDAPVKIEDNVWIGMNCLILKGVTIGANSIIGAGSVVTGQIPRNCVAAGAPAKVIRHIEEARDDD